jgi:hypothetical protein
MIISPSEEARQAFLGGLFGTFELSPRGHGEKVILNVEGGGLEVVGTGLPGKLKEMTLKLIRSGIQVDGILFLLPAGDDDSWDEAKAITHWVQEGGRLMALKTWVFGSLGDLDRETARKSLLTLVNEHQEHLV